MGRLRKILSLSRPQSKKDEEIRILRESLQQAYEHEMDSARNDLQKLAAARMAAQKASDKLCAELEKQQSDFADERGLLTSKNEDLEGKVKDLKADIKLQEEALAHATMQYNITLSQLKTDNTVLTSTVEKEKSAQEKLEVEVESLRRQLSSTSSELESSQAARSELERNNHKEHEEWTRLLDRRDVELNSLKESNENMSLHVGATEAELSGIMNELQIANEKLIERTKERDDFSHLLDRRDVELNSLKESNENMSLRVGATEAELSGIMNELQIANEKLIERTKERDDFSHLLDRRDVELNSLKESNENMSLCVGATEAKVSGIMNELQIANEKLIERTKERDDFSHLLDRRDVELNSLKEINQNLFVCVGATEAKVSAIENGINIANTQVKELELQEEAKRKELEDEISSMKATLNATLSNLENKLQKSNVMLTERTNQLSTIQQELEMERQKQENREEFFQKELEDKISSMKATLDATLSDLENKLQKSNVMLTERTNQLSTIQQELEMERQKQENREEFFQKELEDKISSMKATLDATLSDLENKLQKSNVMLTERTNQLSTIQQELKMERQKQENREEFFQKELEEKVRMTTELESLLTAVQNENLNLKRGFDEARLHDLSLEQNTGDKTNTLPAPDYKEDNERIAVKIHSLNEQLMALQNQNLNLKRQLEEARLHDLSREQGDTGNKLDSLPNYDKCDVQDQTLKLENAKLEDALKNANELVMSLKKDSAKARTVLEEKNAILQEQNSHLRDEMRTAESSKSKLEQQYQHAQSELTDATKRLSVAKASLKAAQRARKVQEKKNTVLQKQNSHMQDEVRTTESMKSDLEQQFQRAQSELTDATKRLSVAETYLEEAQRAHTVLEEKNAVLQEKNTQLRDEMRTTESGKSNLEQQFQRAQSELTDATKRLSVTKASMEDKVRITAELESLLKAVQNENLNLKRGFNEARLHDLSLEQNIGAKTNTLPASDKSDLVHHLQLENAKLEAALKNANDLMMSLKKSSTKMTYRSNRKKAMLEEQISQLQDEVRTTESMKSDLEQQFQRAQSELTDATKRLSVAETYLEEAQRARTVQEEKHAMLQEQNCHLRDELLTAESWKSDLEQKYQRAQSELTHTTKRLSIIEGYMTTLQDNMQRIEREKSKLEAGLKDERERGVPRDTDSAKNNYQMSSLEFEAKLEQIRLNCAVQIDHEVLLPPHPSEEYKLHLTVMEEWGMQELLQKAEKERALTSRKRLKQKKRRQKRQQAKDMDNDA